jgi:hypothetical protein
MKRESKKLRKEIFKQLILKIDEEIKNKKKVL